MLTNKTKNYRNRIVEDEIKANLTAFGAVLIRGPKWSGKTTTGEHFASSAIYLDDVDKSEQYNLIAKNNPSLFCEGATPRLLDEWQSYPVIWDAVRRAVDRGNKQDGQFILTGSYSPKDGATKHTGAMRIAAVEMETMTLYESGESSGQVSLLDLFDANKDIAGAAKLSRDDLTMAMVRGFYPGAVLGKASEPSIYGRQAIKSLCSSDLSEALGARANEEMTRALLRSLARNIASPVRNGTIMEDVKEAGHPISDSSFYSYMDGLRRLFVLREVPSWNPNIRSATSMRSSPKRLFYETSLACASLGINAASLSEDFKTRGLMFECLCAKELSVYARKYGGSISYYRDRYGLECDFVVHLGDGRYGLFECKCGDGFIEEGASHLNKLESGILSYISEHRNTSMAKPSCKVLLTDGEFSLRREDGVSIVPVSCFKD